MAVVEFEGVVERCSASAVLCVDVGTVVKECAHEVENAGPGGEVQRRVKVHIDGVDVGAGRDEDVGDMAGAPAGRDLAGAHGLR